MKKLITEKELETFIALHLKDKKRATLNCGNKLFFNCFTFSKLHFLY